VKPAAQSVPGVIDTLTAGFQVVHRLPWVLGFPVALDLVVWLGPRVSAGLVLDRLLVGLTELLRQGAGAAGGTALGQVDQLQTQIDALRGGAAALNVLSLLAFGGFLMHSAVPQDVGGLGGRVDLTSGWLLLFVLLALLLLGVALACIWLGAIAQQARDGQFSASRLARTAPRYWLTIVAFVGLVIAGGLGVAIPLALVSAVGQLIAPAVGAFLGLMVALAIQLAIFWALLYLYFFVDAVVISEVGPIRAATSSVRVVSSNFWSTLGFIIITWVIMSGMGLIWGSLARLPAGQLVSIVGNGYVESGLAAASMLFYRNRISRLSR
jgi:hypothetical protein